MSKLDYFLEAYRLLGEQGEFDGSITGVDSYKYQFPSDDHKAAMDAIAGELMGWGLKYDGVGVCYLQ